MRLLPPAVLALLLSACADPTVACGPDSCPDPDRVCVEHEDTGATCDCPAGTRDVDGVCEPLGECGIGACHDRGSCTIEGAGAVCACDAGYAGAECEACADGFHDDGAGGCTSDACTPSPCDPERTCVDVSGVAECRCRAGQHDEGGTCVPDTTCMATTCGGHGTCTDGGGSVSCACEAGWSGAYCGRCDEGGGYHDDGMGGCTTDACLPNPCTAANRTVCAADDTAGTVCLCDAGHHDDGAGGCAADEACTTGRCGDHGTCSDLGGVVECACDLGWSGGACDACDAGYHDDGSGGCTTDVCLPNPCTATLRGVCSPDGSGGVLCACDPGAHEDGSGGCVPDEACLPSSCNGHGVCSDGGGVVRCACSSGWAGAACGVCDAAMGYHADGAGGCTTDVCLPNPCVGANRSVCSPTAGGGTSCGCDPGYHDVSGVCALDETCTSTTCNGHGACSDAGGVVSCSCSGGWAGTYCGACDAAMGYHADGMGGCTTDACVPNPCGAPNRGVCADVGGSASCSCDAGYHDDGVGGCTTDPCLPDPCAAAGQLCRDSGGAAECYTPTCNDGNPCTDDSFDGASCVYTPRADGSTCSTTLCTAGQTCTAGACGGGVTVSCDDSNPCTIDGCDALLGCQHTADDTLVPDDGASCTVDACASGVASHVATDSRCDDGLYCTGVATCSPASPSADSRGCVVSAVPTAPGPDGPCGTWSCDEGSGSFTLMAAASGTSCDDTVRCTSSDACDGAGACRGTPTASCGDGPTATCSTTSPLGAGVDIPRAHVFGSLTFGGGALVPSRTDQEVNVWLQDRATGALTHLEQVDFGAWSGSEYPVRSYDFRDDGVIALDVVPGVYDVIYERLWGTDPMRDWGYRQDGTYPYGRHRLREGVVLGPGPNALDVDLPVARVTGALTFAGGAAVASRTDQEVNVWLRNQATGAMVHLEQIDFDAWNGSEYPVRSYDFRDDRVIDLDVIPGTYDVIYQRLWGTTAERDWGYRSDGTYPYGTQLLRTGVVLGPGTNTLNVDIPAAHVSGTLTFAGGAAVPSAQDQEVNVWLRNQATGAMVHLEQIDFDSWSGSNFPVRSYDFRDDRVIDLDVIPGTYDLIYERLWGTTPARDWGYRPDRTYPYGQQMLATGIVLAAGANPLNVDIPAAHVTGTLSFGGGPAVASTQDQEVNLWLRNRATGAMVHLEQIDFDAWSGSNFPVRSYDFRDDRVIDLDVIPGTYDVVYERLWGTDPAIDWGYRPDGTYPYGQHVLVAGVVLGAGANPLNVSLPSTRISGAYTFGGGPAVPSRTDQEVNVWLRDRSTGALVHLEQIDFDSWSGSQYPVRSYDFRDDRVIDLDVLPGTYDVVYRRLWGTDPARDWGYRTDGSYAYGDHVLRACVQIP